MTRGYVLSIAALLMASGCSSSNSSPHMVTITAECTAYGTATCGHLNACSPSGFKIDYASMTDCQSYQALYCAVNEASPNSGWTSSTIAACNTARSANNCDPVVPTDQTPCVFAGSAAAGAACYFSYQCQSRSCSGTSGGVCGTCDKIGNPGDACGGTTGTACPVGGECTKAGKCATLVGSGATCDLTANICVSGLTCVRASSTAKMGTCTADAATAGAMCNSDGVGAPVCNGGLGFFCDNTSVCQAVTSVATTMACGSMMMGMSYAVCQNGDECDNGLCTARLASGAACSIGHNPGCTYGYYCVATSAGNTAGTCKPLMPTTCM
jgi:hypothetical protein